MTPILVQMRPLPGTRTPNSTSVWRAFTEVGNVRFEARSRHSVIGVLARQLVAAGIAEAPLEVHFEGTARCMRWSSISAAARYTISEGAATPIGRVVWKEFPGAEGFRSTEPPHGVGQNRGKALPYVSGEGGAARHSKNPTPLSVTCAGCGRAFTPKRSDARTCSTRCRQRAYRQQGPQRRAKFEEAAE